MPVDELDAVRAALAEYLGWRPEECGATPIDVLDRRLRKQGLRLSAVVADAAGRPAPGDG